MIAYISGLLVSKSPNVIVVDVQGVGYQIFIPLSTFYHLPEPSKTISLYVYTHVREDALQLYGFLKPEEKAVFLQVLGVSGIGPKLALNILSGLPLEVFIKAVSVSDVAKLASIPGVGKKTAERLDLELKDKVKAVVQETITESGSPFPMPMPLVDDAVSALVNLGYKPLQAKDAVKKVLASVEGDFPIESLIKETLRVLSK